MPYTHLFSAELGTSVSLRLFRRFGSLLLSLPGVVLIVVHLSGQAPIANTPGELLATTPADFIAWLETRRPAPRSTGDRARILAALPTEGEVTELEGGERLKLAAVNQLLHAAGRHSWYDVKVTDVPYARIVVFERSVILISKSALTLLDGQDLQALVAHDIGHEYFAIEYERALKMRDRRRLKDLELLCDAFAIVTLRRLGMDPSRLVEGIEKITQYNQMFFATTIDDANYPTVAERRSFVREITAWAARAAATGRLFHGPMGKVHANNFCATG